MKAARVLLVVCFALLFASCSLKPTWDVVGKWEKVGGKETLEFLQNGNLKLVSGSATVSAPYSFSDPKHMKIQFGSLGNLAAEVTVAGDTLTITGPDKKAITYKKVKEGPPAQSTAAAKPAAKPQEAPKAKEAAQPAKQATAQAKPEAGHH